tara:strand:+ start:734 stop:1093 length:360 start_codon:yes stop_codon:yes gene_type:complete
MTIQKFAIFSTDGLPQGFYSDDVNKVIPDNAVKITHDQWVEFIENSGRKKWDGSKVADYTPPKQTKTELWIIDMRNSDMSMPRTLEDIIDALDDHVREAISAQTIEKYNSKKTLRSKKP